jgi:surface protein
MDVPSTDGGSVSPSGSKIYEEDEEVEIEASSNEEYTFSGWSGDMESSENPLTLTVDQDYELTANFEIKSYELSVNTDGEGEVAEEVVQQSKDYESGTVVELTANPAEGYEFVEWAGDVTGSDNPVEVTVDGPKEVTAVFEKQTFALTTNTDGEGTVARTPNQETYEYGTEVELEATPSTGWQFVEWTNGDASSSDNSQTITMVKDTSLTAVFEKKTYALTVNTDGSGSVTKTPDQSTYEYGSTVQLEATPDQGQRFVEWTGAVESTDKTIELSIDGETQVTAIFGKKKFYLAENGVKIKCPEADIGDSGTVGDITYTKREVDDITTSNAETTCTTDIANMNRLFNGAESFNADLSSWDVSKVTDMRRMFRDAKTFNADLSHWDVSNVTNMERMFSDASSFESNLSEWDVSGVTDMSRMFQGAVSFNSDISNWDVGLVGDIKNMFSGASSFSGDLSSWDVSKVTSMNAMFQKATSFNSDIGDWDVSSVSGMQRMFEEAASFNQDLSDWCVQLIDSEPHWFDDGSPLESYNDYQPQWGTCPS